MSSLSQRLKFFNEGLLPDMVQLKYKAMAENAFRFFRGTCHLYYEDLAKAEHFIQSPVTWICGDLHIENYGSYKGENRLVYFDLNDFDEGILAPAAWEISRMLTSIFVAFKALKIGEAEALRMVTLFLKTYSATLSRGKPISIEPRTAKGIVCSFLEKEANRKVKELLDKRTMIKKGKLVLSLDHDRHFALEKGLKRKLMDHITNWISTSSDGPYNYRVMDVVFRLAGTGSVGVKRYLFLLRNAKDKSQYLFLDMKQANASSVQPFVKIEQPVWESDGDRVYAIQQRMQNVLPALISVTKFQGDSYVIEEMQPTEDKIDFNVIKKRYRDIYQVVDDMASLAASAQLRSAGRQGSAIADELIAFGTNTEWQNDLIAYAEQYAQHARKDYKRFLADYKKGLFEPKQQSA